MARSVTMALRGGHFITRSRFVFLTTKNYLMWAIIYQTQNVNNLLYIFGDILYIKILASKLIRGKITIKYRKKLHVSVRHQLRS